MPTIGSTLLQAYQCGVFGNPLWLPWWLRYKESACSAGDLGLIPGSGRSPEKGNGYPIQYFCLENSRDRGAWWAIVHGVSKSQTRLKRISVPACVCAKSLQSCPTLCSPMDCSPPGSFVHGILLAGILECVAMPSSRGSS